jgi:sulfur-oxidizing protein SoxY
LKKNNSKREFLKLSSSSVLLLKLFSFGFFLSKPALASAWKEAWFSTNDLMETLKVMGVKDITESKKITVSAPETAENGAYVGVGINTSIENVDMVAILVDKNPNILSGYFEFNSKVRPDIATKIKMAESSDIITVIKTINDQYYMAKKSVNVTLGGCGS